MCGRYCITSAPEAIRALFRYREQPNFPARYNVAPTQPVPIVRMAEGEREFALVRWGLIPAWVKDPKVSALLINARAEIGQRQARLPQRHEAPPLSVSGRRLLRVEAGRHGKRPYFARPVAGGPIAFAGLWETWIGPNGEEMETAAIVTTEANAEMAAVHHRAPVIVPPEQFDFWLDCSNVDEQMAAALLAPAPDGSMEVYEISPAVNRVANDSPVLLEPYSADAAPAPAGPAETRSQAAAGRGQRARFAVLSFGEPHALICALAPILPLCGDPSFGATDRPRERPDEDRADCIVAAVVCRAGPGPRRRQARVRTQPATSAEQQKKSRQEEKAYKDALQRIPNQKPADPWGKMR